MKYTMLYKKGIKELSVKEREYILRSKDMLVFEHTCIIKKALAIQGTTSYMPICFSNLMK